MNQFFWFSLPSCPSLTLTQPLLERHKIIEIMRTTGVSITKWDAQPEFFRPTPFYYMIGPYWTITHATFLIQRMISDYQHERILAAEQRLDIDTTTILKSDVFTLNKKISLWKALGLDHTSTNLDIIKFLNTLCVQNTKIEQIGCYNPNYSSCQCEWLYFNLHEQVQDIEIKIVGTEYAHITKSRNIILEHIFDRLNTRAEEWHQSYEDTVGGPVIHKDDPLPDKSYRWGTH